MYAVIRTGGKQYKVAPGDRIRVEKLGAPEASLTPLLVVDGTTVTTDAQALAGLPVDVTVVGEGRGKKIRAGKYKNKTRYRRRWGHRQDFSLIEIRAIGGRGKPVEAPPEAEPEASIEPDAAPEPEAPVAEEEVDDVED